MAETFVLAHELGHTGHFTLAQKLINHILNQKHQCTYLKPFYNE